MITEQEIKQQYSEMTIEQLVSELFRMLESVEESDSGRVFHPTTISTVRVLHSMRLRELMPLMKAKADGY